jgi:sugar lactone lactonase YvrE
MISRRQVALSLLGAPLIARAAGRLPTHKAKVVRLFKSPDGHPNALEATPDGLWVGEQVTDKAYLLDWKSGKVLQQVETESSNTSGIAYGGGYIWMAANGAALGRLARRDEPKHGRIVKVDPQSGRTVGVYTTPDGGGCHGLVYAEDKLWMTCFKWNVIAAVDPGTFQVIHKIPSQLTRPHGLAWDPPGIWVGYSNDWLFIKQDAKDGHPMEIIELQKGVDPDPHGMDMYQGKMYYCDAGIAPPGIASGSPHAGYICRVELA